MKSVFGLLLFLVLLLLSCRIEKGKNQDISSQHSPQEAGFKHAGHYADDVYAQRNEGYDWVGVIVEELDNDQIKIAVRSRADKKRPTCTFDAEAFRVNDSTFQAMYNGQAIHFVFSSDSLQIKSLNRGEDLALYFFCSGGATLAGTYQRIDGTLDEGQVDPTSFFRVMELQDVGFNVRVIPNDSIKVMTIFSFGLENRFDESYVVTGYQITDAAVEDMNSDGSPELLVFGKKEDESAEGQVWVFSVNNGLSMSQVYFMPTRENAQINAGYRGGDEFTMVETYLGQRFPIYLEGDKPGHPSGGTRQVMYKLAEGEAMRKLVVHEVTPY
jgi:hypothetical protein